VVLALRDQLRRLQKRVGGGTVKIPQPDGTVARFPAGELETAFLINLERLRGRDVPLHPLALAAAASPDPAWNQSAFSTIGTEAAEDLSEP
jgi:hypothetical protein